MVFNAWNQINIKRLEDSYEQRFPDNEQNEKISSPLDPGDHLELDTSPMLDDTGTKIFQSLTSAFQWVITLGRWDIMTAVITLSSFQALSRVGHLERVKRVYNYLMNY